MSDIRALVATRNGGGDVLAVEHRLEPSPGPGEVAVEMAAVGVNFIDVYQREGVYPTEAPFVIGNEGAGVVRSVGEGVTGLAPGDRVAWPFMLGSAAEIAVAPAESVVPVPDGVDLETAAAVIMQGLTAHFLTRSTYEVSEGTLALVHAAGAPHVRELGDHREPVLRDGLEVGLVGLRGAGQRRPADLAVRYGYQRYQPDVMAVTVILLLILVQVLQMVGDRLVIHFSRK